MNLKRFTIVFILAFYAVITWSQTSKTGILLVHYGTANDSSRSLTIDKLNKLVSDKFYNCDVVEAYAASAVIKTLAKRGTYKLNIPQALDSLKNLGCTHLVVQSTMLLDGVMTDMLKKNIDNVRKNFKKISLGKPLLYSVADCRNLIAMINENLLADKSLNVKNAQVVLVGHGSDSPANAIYSQIDYLLKDEGKLQWHVGTIEGYPTMSCVERQVKAQKSKSIILVPLLYIAGNHQKEDINGVWREQFEKEGYKVSVVSKGLGEMEEIQRMILDKLSALVSE